MFFNCWIFRERDICVLKGVLWGPGGQVEVYDYAKGQFCWTFWAHLFQISSDVFLFCFLLVQCQNESMNDEGFIGQIWEHIQEAGLSGNHIVRRRY